MDRIKVFVGGIFSSIFGLLFFVLVVMSLPLNILAMMRLWGWEWWTAFIIVGIYTIIPLVGQLAYIVFTFMGAYYLIDAGWSWRDAINPLPKTFSVATMQPAEFEKLKSDTILPQLTRQCIEDAKARFAIDGKISVSAARFCECFAKVAVETTTQEDIAYQEDNRRPSPGHEARMKEAISAKCSL